VKRQKVARLQKVKLKLKCQNEIKVSNKSMIRAHKKDAKGPYKSKMDVNFSSPLVPLVLVSLHVEISKSKPMLCFEELDHQT